MDVMKRIDPEFLAFLDMMPHQDLNMNELPAIRSASEKMFEQILSQLSPIQGVITENRTIPGPKNDPDITARMYRPKDHPGHKPAILWIHGGGYILGNLELDDYEMKMLSANLQCVIVSINYRLAPECPFPAAIEDCYAALKWMWENSNSLNIDKSRIAIGGGSAGGGLAAGLAILARDRGEVALAYQLLISPMIDDRNDTLSSRSITDDRLWSREKNLVAWKAYLGELAGRDDVSPYAAASRAKDLSGLPPAFITVGEIDLFVDEDIKYAQRLIQAGVSTELHVYPGAIHGFDKVAEASVTKRFSTERDQAIKKIFNLV